MGGGSIPDICHFFYTGKISENKIYTEKRVHKRCQLSNYYTEKYQFCVHSGKIYTGQKKFTPAPPVVPVTNIRYGLKAMQGTLPWKNSTRVTELFSRFLIRLSRICIQGYPHNPFGVQPCQTESTSGK